MSQNKFMEIDRDNLCAGYVAEFNIFLPTSISSEMDCFLTKGAIVRPEDKKRIDEEEFIYINQQDKKDYQFFRDNYTLYIKRVEHDNKSAVVYAKAINTIEELYNNPDISGGSEKSKDVVNNLVKIILGDEFTLRSLMQIATHDYFTHTHSLNVSIYSITLGSFLILNEDELSDLGEAALLHDLGKSKIDKEIINKNGKLTDEEFSKVKKHPELGFQLAISMGIKNKSTLYGIRYHHEKMNGTGYPLGLMGESIPLNARIIGLCDIFDALTSRRSYKNAMSSFEALKLMKTEMKNHIDLKLLNVMIKMFK